MAVPLRWLNKRWLNKLTVEQQTYTRLDTDPRRAAQVRATLPVVANPNAGDRAGPGTAGRGRNWLICSCAGRLPSDRAVVGCLRSDALWASVPAPVGSGLRSGTGTAVCRRAGAFGRVKA